MWKPDAPWETVASVKVMTFVAPNLDRVTDSDLKLALDDMKRRHIALAVGTGMIVRSDRCRSNTEAYVNPGALEFIFEKVRRNGGDVKYVAMDEPYFWGRCYSGPRNARDICSSRSSICLRGRTYREDVMNWAVPKSAQGAPSLENTRI